MFIHILNIILRKQFVRKFYSVKIFIKGTENFPIHKFSNLQKFMLLRILPKYD